MAPTGKKTEAWLEKEGIIGPSYSRRPQHKRSGARRRAQTYQSTDIQKMVYRLLNAGQPNQGAESKRLSPSQARWVQKLLQRYREHLQAAHDKADQSDDSASSASESTRGGSVVEMIETTNSSRSTNSQSSVSNVSQRANPGQPMTMAESIENMRNLLSKEPVVQMINSCFKAGIEEGKRRARKYIRNVLSFGLSAGLLVPGDVQSTRSSLRIQELKRADAESRLRRRRERRGEEVPPNVKRKDLRRGTWTAAKSKAQGADSADAAKKRGRKSKSRSPRTSPNPGGASRAEKTGARRGRKDERRTKRKPVEKNQTRSNRYATRNYTASARYTRSQWDHSATNLAAIQLAANEANQRMLREKVRSASRSKSVPPQTRPEEPRDNVERAVELERLAGPSCQCEQCDLIGNDA